MILTKIYIKCMSCMIHHQSFTVTLVCYHRTNVLHTKMNKLINKQQTNKTIIANYKTIMLQLAVKKNPSKENEDIIKNMQELTLELFYLYINISVMQQYSPKFYETFLKDLVFAEDIKLLDRNSSSMYYLYSNLFSSLDRKKKQFDSN